MEREVFKSVAQFENLVIERVIFANNQKSHMRKLSNE